MGMNEHKTVLRGREAQAVLDNEAFKSAIETLKSSVLDQWKACPIRDKEGQVLLLQLAKLTDKFESILVGLVEQGKLSQRKIDLDDLRNESRSQRILRKVVNG